VRVGDENRIARLLRERESLLVGSPSGDKVAHPVRESGRGRERSDPDARLRGRGVLEQPRDRRACLPQPTPSLEPRPDRADDLEAVRRRVVRE